MNKKADVIRVYLPPDANCLLSVMDHCLRSRNYVNVVVAGKQPAPQWLTWRPPSTTALREWAFGIGQATTRVLSPIGFGGCGDVPTLEALAAYRFCAKSSRLKIRIVNVVDLMKLQPSSEQHHGLSDIHLTSLRRISLSSSRTTVIPG